MDARHRVAGRPQRPLSTFEITLQVQKGNEKEASLLSQLNKLAMEAEFDANQNPSQMNGNAKHLPQEVDDVEPKVDVNDQEPIANDTAVSDLTSKAADVAQKPEICLNKEEDLDLDVAGKQENDSEKIDVLKPTNVEVSLPETDDNTPQENHSEDSCNGSETKDNTSSCQEPEVNQNHEEVVDQKSETEAEKVDDDQPLGSAGSCEPKPVDISPEEGKPDAEPSKDEDCKKDEVEGSIPPQTEAVTNVDTASCEPTAEPENGQEQQDSPHSEMVVKTLADQIVSKAIRDSLTSVEEKHGDIEPSKSPTHSHQGDDLSVASGSVEMSSTENRKEKDSQKLNLKEDNKQSDDVNDVNKDKVLEEERLSSSENEAPASERPEKLNQLLLPPPEDTTQDDTNDLPTPPPLDNDHVTKSESQRLPPPPFDLPGPLDPNDLPLPPDLTPTEYALPNPPPSMDESDLPHPPEVGVEDLPEPPVPITEEQESNKGHPQVEESLPLPPPDLIVEPTSTEEEASGSPEKKQIEVPKVHVETGEQCPTEKENKTTLGEKENQTSESVKAETTIEPKPTQPQAKATNEQAAGAEEKSNTKPDVVVDSSNPAKVDASGSNEPAATTSAESRGQQAQSETGKKVKQPKSCCVIL